MWVSCIWQIPDPFNEVTVGTDIKSANQIDASLSATVLPLNPCRTDCLLGYYHFYSARLIQPGDNADITFTCCVWCPSANQILNRLLLILWMPDVDASSVHVCRPQTLPWAHHHQVCRDEEAGGHTWGGAHTHMQTSTQVHMECVGFQLRWICPLWH